MEQAERVALACAVRVNGWRPHCHVSEPLTARTFGVAGTPITRLKNVDVLVTEGAPLAWIFES